MGRTRGYFNPVQRCSNEIRPAFKNSEVTNLLNPDCAFGIVACSFWFLLFLFLTKGLADGSCTWGFLSAMLELKEIRYTQELPMNFI